MTHLLDKQHYQFSHKSICFLSFSTINNNSRKPEDSERQVKILYQALLYLSPIPYMINHPKREYKIKSNSSKIHIKILITDIL